MAPASKDNGKTSIHEDLDCGDTQPLDPHSPTCDGESRYFEDTVPFDDDNDDDFETQRVDLAGETQVLDFAAGETQPLDDFDGGDDDDDADTQLMDECSDGTQVLEDVDGDDVSHSDTQSAESKEVPCDSSDKKLSGNADVVVHEHNSSGLRPPRYTFLRAESLREAALAARNMALKRTQSETNSVMGMSQSCQEPLAIKDIGESFPSCYEKVRDIDQECNLGKNSVEIKAVTNKNMNKVASSAVRKLFNDDLPVETNVRSLCSNDFNGGECLDRLPVYQGEFEGLSYVNSQEPGELSQVNALDVVDRFLQDIMEFDQDTDHVKNKTAVTTTKPCSTNHVMNAEEKLKFLSSAKGQQSLAKRVSDRGKDITIGIYELDDSREDEGGGDIYLRRKEDFLGGKTRRPKSLPGFQKAKARVPNDDKDGDKNSSIPNRRKTAVQSDSRLGMHNLKGRDNTIKEATRKLKKNLGSEFDEQVNTNCSRGEMEPKVNADAQETLDVGLDTQLAAEAMEALCNAEEVANDAIHVTRSSVINQLNIPSTGKVGPATSRECSRQLDKKRKVAVKSDLQTSGLSKKCAKEVKQFKRDNIRTRSKRSRLNAEDNRTSSADENGRRDSSPTIDQRKSAGALERLEPCELNNHDSSDRGSGRRRVNKRKLQGEGYHFTPVAHRTRQSLAVNQFIQPDIPSESLRKEDIGIGSLEKSSGTGLQASKALDPNSTPKAITVSVSNGVEMDTLDCPRRRRSLRIKKLSDHDKGSEKLVGSSKPSAQPEDIGKSTTGKTKMRTDSRTVVKSHVNCRKQSSSYGGSAMPSIDQERRKILEPNLDTERPGDTPFCCNVIAEKDANQKQDGKNNADVQDSANNCVVTSLNELPRDRCESSDLGSATPANCRTPVNDASPVCRGDDYYKQSCNANLSRSCLHKVLRKELQRELRSLSTIRPELTTPSKDLRKRRDMTDVRVLYSHRLDEDIIKHQKKILARLGVSVASSIADATHFIADQFVRTRNMLEAIAFGKPVVTHLWIESCGQASCFIDEKNYLLRDAKKEKEFGFSMPVSLARASQHPLLEGRRVLITPNTKPSKEVISSLVKAVQGQAVERLGRSVLKGNKIPGDLLILSCEEDYASCVPFLEKGAMVYSSELLLNGLVIQKLEYERHRLFADHVKKTRSTIWLKKKDDRIFLPVTKCI